MLLLEGYEHQNQVTLSTYEALCHSKDETPIFKNSSVMYQYDCPCPECYISYSSKN